MFGLFSVKSDPFENAYEIGRQVIDESKKREIEDLSIEMDIRNAEVRLHNAAIAGNEEEYSSIKAEIERLKNHLEVMAIRKVNNARTITDEEIRTIFSAVIAETENEEKRLLHELVLALEKADEIIKAGNENITRYNNLVEFWSSYVLHTMHFFYQKKPVSLFGKLNNEFRISQIRKYLNE